MRDYQLSDAQIEQFLQDGLLVLPDCFGREAATAMIDDAYAQLGYDPHDAATWEKPLAFLFPSSPTPMREFAPRAWSGVCQLVGGEERVGHRDCGMGQWVINFRRGADEPWEAPSPRVKGWHVDGNFFRHFLDSAEQGLLVVPIFSDIEHKGGGTVFAADSVPVVARFLRDHAAGVRPSEFLYPDLLSQCRDFRELTGRAGDVALMHPFMLHSFAQNHAGKPRFITNVCVALKEPMRFNRADAKDFSPVEQAVLQGLGVERFDFQASAPRERIDPQKN